MKRVLMALALAVSLASCGEDTVEGNTYEAAGGAISLAFKSGGKATFALGPTSQECTYAQSGKSVSVTCAGDKVDFTIADDGSLKGPPQAAFATMTKKKA